MRPNDDSHSSFMAGVLGAAVGATIAVILSDKDRRKRLMDVLDGVADRSKAVADKVEDRLGEKAVDVRHRLEDKADDVAKDVKKRLSDR